MLKAVKDLERGDKIDNQGEVLIVEAIDKGLWPGSRMITWRNRTASGKDWSNMDAGSKVYLANENR